MDLVVEPYIHICNRWTNELNSYCGGKYSLDVLKKEHIKEITNTAFKYFSFSVTVAAIITKYTVTTALTGIIGAGFLSLMIATHKIYVKTNIRKYGFNDGPIRRSIRGILNVINSRDPNKSKKEAVELRVLLGVFNIIVGVIVTAVIMNPFIEITATCFSLYDMFCFLSLVCGKDSSSDDLNQHVLNFLRS